LILMATTDAPTTIPGTGPETREPAPPLVELYLEDLAVTALLRHGRILKTPEITSAAEGLSLPRTALSDALHDSTRLRHHEREWNLAIRAQRAAMAREERDRQPLETTLSELLLTIGKPLPLPVIARELTFLRGAFQANFKDLAAGALAHARWAIEVAPSTFFHRDFLLDTHASTEELIVRANGLDLDPSYLDLQDLELPNSTGNLVEDAVNVLHAADRPLSHKVLGFLLWKKNPQIDTIALARATADRTRFYQFTGGFLVLTEQMPLFKEVVQQWAESMGGGVAQVDVAALLRQRNVKSAAPARDIQQEIIEDLKAVARRSSGQPVSLALVMSDVLEVDPDDPQFVPTLHALNDKLRGDSEFLPVGIGQYLLRESIPSHVGETPELLRPIMLSVRDPETDEPLDFEMSDDGLEGDAAEFVHDPQWEDVGEEAEVRLARKPGESDTATKTRAVILNHHHRAGTLKLRRVDEEFFGVSGAFTRLNITGAEGPLEAWTSRESGLIYGLGDWFQPRTPASGGVLSFTKEGSGIRATIEAPDKLTHLEGHRAEELENLRAAANYMSLFELLQTIMSEHGGGMELATLWAEVNIVRRTSKRLLCSILSGYHCYYFKQRGPKQILWRYDASKLDQGFKRNKRKYVRR
jgi:hypothetical protein